MSSHSKTAFLFPGLNGLLRRADRVRFAELPESLEYFSKAESVLKDGFGTEISFSDFLKKSTEEIYHVQNVSLAAVAIVCLQSAVAKKLSNKIGQPDWVMGCSLGDLARSIFAGAYAFEDAVYNHVYFTRRIDGIDQIGANIGVLAPKDQPFSPDDFQWFEEMQVDVSKLTPRFLNVGGRFQELEKIEVISKTKGWNVMKIMNYPAHSRYILPYVERVEVEALRARVQAPHVPMFSSFSSRPLTEPIEIKREFLLSITMPIHWHRGIESLHSSHGVTRFINIGPCRSLSAMMRDIPVEVETLEASELLAV